MSERTTMKRCPQCGFVHLSPQEKLVMGKLPSSSSEIANRLELSRRHVFQVLRRLEKVKKVKRLSGAGASGLIFTRLNSTEIQDEKEWQES